MAGSAESVEQVWLLGRVVTVCWLGAALFVLAERGVPRMQTIRLPNIQSVWMFIFSFRAQLDVETAVNSSRSTH